MASKNVKGAKKVKREYKKFVDNTAGPLTRKVLTKVTTLGAGYAKEITPREYGALINSQFRRTERVDTNNWLGIVGYAQDYAVYLHGTETYTPLWKPVPPDEKKGPSWNYLAVPRFLELGFEGKAAKPVIQKAIREGYKK